MEQLADAKARLGCRGYRPFPKQQEFHRLGAAVRERLFIAGNQLGKTFAGANEAALHATGLYPEGWDGRRFDRPTVGWVTGLSGEQTRDNAQRLLLGRGRDYGTGALPSDTLIGSPQLARGVADAVDYVKVRHVSGGTSYIYFKSYEKGRERIQGETIDWAWCDEEPDEKTYTEIVTRTNAVLGPVWITFTPLLGMSNVVRRFLQSPPEERQYRGYVTMTIDDVPHLSAEQRAAIIAGYPEWERDARARGVPMLGTGRIYPVDENRLKFDLSDFPKGVPSHWPRIAGMDFGHWDHPLAWVALAWDREADTLWLYDCYRESRLIEAVHQAAAKERLGPALPVAWPHDGHQHDRNTGVPLATKWRQAGLNMLPEHAQWEDGSNGVEPGLSMLLDMMMTGRFRVAAHLSQWWEEYRTYHRESGKVVKTSDDLLDATRYAVMMLRYARAVNGRVEAPRVIRSLSDAAAGVMRGLPRLTATGSRPRRRD